ncbi:hypothetical protein V8C86DRAFT_2560573 [Haematococcus lacustris]
MLVQVQAGDQTPAEELLLLCAPLLAPALGCDLQQQGPGCCKPAPGLQLHQPRASRQQLEDGRPQGHLLAGCPVLPCLRCRSHQPGPGPAVLLGQLPG